MEVRALLGHPIMEIVMKEDTEDSDQPDAPSAKGKPPYFEYGNTGSSPVGASNN